MFYWNITVDESYNKKNGKNWGERRTNEKATTDEILSH